MCVIFPTDLIRKYGLFKRETTIYNDDDYYYYDRTSYSYLNFGYERDIYGALVKRNAVCMGYAISFKAAMDKMKVPCTFELTKSGDHVWNKVKIGKKWYAVDTTWNDVYNIKYYLLIKKHPCSGKQKSF